jgi:hypothetical protein
VAVVIPARDYGDRIYSGGGETSFTPLFLLLCFLFLFCLFGFSVWCLLIWEWLFMVVGSDLWIL